MKKVLMLLLLLATPAVAQQKMVFALADSATRHWLDEDWWKRIDTNQEWAYCVVAWGVSATADGDTVYVVQGVKPAPTTKSAKHGVTFGCNDVQGRPLPTIHAHLGNSCSPSRADWVMAEGRKAEFEMITCGPGITNGFVWRGATTVAVGR